MIISTKLTKPKPPIMNAKEIHIFISLYFNNLLSKMERDLTRQDFIQALSDNIDSTWLLKKEQASIILEYIIIAKSLHVYEGKIVSNEKLLLFTLSNFVSINGYWEEHVSKMPRRFSHIKYLSDQDRYELHQSLESICNSSYKFETFFKELDVYIDLAQKRDVAYDETNRFVRRSVTSYFRNWPFIQTFIDFKKN